MTASATTVGSLTSRQRRVLSALAAGPATSLEIARRCQLPRGAVVLLLLTLMEKGDVERIGIGPDSRWRLAGLG